MASTEKKILILGGGFGGLYAAMELERLFKSDVEVSITVVNQDNFLLFTPMLHEVAASDLDPTDIVSPIHKMLRKSVFFCGSVEHCDLDARTVTVSHGANFHTHVLHFDYLVIALGSVTNFYQLPGLSESALTMKTLGDAMQLRNRMIANLEEADFECVGPLREKLLTFVIAGGGFAGVETAAAVHDFLHSVQKFYPRIADTRIRTLLACSGETLLPELNRRLGKYAGDLLCQRGIEILFNTKVTGYQEKVVKFSDGSEIPAQTLIWTAGSSPNPLLKELSCAKERGGRILVDDTLAVAGYESVWAIGDCCAVPDGLGGFHPPTAQHATREARIVARNIHARISGGPVAKFKFRTLGQLASLGHRRGVAQVFGICFSGFFAWWLWRSIYLVKLPRWEKRIRVALNWTLDILFSKDTVQLPVVQASNMRAPLNI